MMQTYKKLVFFITCILVIAVCFSGCSGIASVKENKPISVAFTVAIRKNNAKPALDSQKLNEDITYAAKTDGSKIAAVEVDGEPYVITSQFVEVQYGISEAMKSKDANVVIQSVASKINETTPKTAEADIIKGISKATRELTASDSPEGNRVLYILDGGLQTTGQINMSTTNILDGFTDETVEKIAQNLPDMSSINNVYWIGLGDFADEQECISESNKTKLKNFWRAVLETAGTTVDFLDDNTTNEPTSEEWPSVSKVTFVNDIVTVDDLDLESGYRLDETTVSFKPNTAEFVDKDAAVNAITELSAVLKANSNRSILLVGSTATYGDPENCIILSKKRAEAVKTLMIELGVSNNQINTVGIGQAEAPFKVKDISENGTLLEDKAKINRAVFVFDGDSDKVKLYN